MGAENSFISNVTLKAHARKGHRGRVIATFIDSYLMRIIGVCSTGAETFNCFNGLRIHVYNTTEDIMSAYYDTKKQLLVIGQIKGNIKVLTASNLRVIIELSITKAKIYPSVSSIYECDNILVAGYSNGMAKKFTLDGKELAYFSPIMNKKFETLDISTIKQNVLPYLNYSSMFAPVRHIKVSAKTNRILVAYYDHFKNEESQVVKLVNNAICVFDYEKGKNLGEMTTSGNSLLSMELLEKKSYVVTLEGDSNNVYIYDYFEMAPLLKYNLSLAGILEGCRAISLQVIENSEALMVAYRSELRTENIGDFFMFGFDDGKILSSTYKINKGEGGKMEMEWAPRFVYKHKDTLDKLQKLGYNPKDFSICSLYADPITDTCLGGDFDGNIIITTKLFSGIVSKNGLNQESPSATVATSAISIYQKIKEGIPHVWRNITHKLQSLVTKRPGTTSEVEMSSDLSKQNLNESAVQILPDNANASASKEEAKDKKEAVVKISIDDTSKKSEVMNVSTDDSHKKLEQSKEKNESPDSLIVKIEESKS